VVRQEDEAAAACGGHELIHLGGGERAIGPEVDDDAAPEPAGTGEGPHACDAGIDAPADDGVDGDAGQQRAEVGSCIEHHRVADGGDACRGRDWRPWRRAVDESIHRRGPAGTGVGVHLSAGTGGGGRRARGRGSTMGAASGTDVDGEGADGLGDGASAAVRDALHPVAASRMNRPAWAIRFVNGALLR